jgi:hypothetical protein
MRNGSGIMYSLQGRALYVRPITSGTKPPIAGRSNITAFSVRSGARMRRFLRCCDAQYRIMGTLTYPAEFPRSGRVVKAHFRAFVERCRRYHEREGHAGWSIFWFLEFQARGAPHFHFFTNYEIPRDLLALWWYDVVGSGDKRHLLAGTRIEYLRAGRSGAISYASKYAAKVEQKAVPAGFEDVGRFWGAVGLVSCHAFFILVPFEEITGPTHRALELSLREALKRSDGHWKRMDFGEKRHLVRGITMFDDQLCAEVEGILQHYGLLLSVRNAATVVEYPNIECLPGEIL